MNKKNINIRKTLLLGLLLVLVSILMFTIQNYLFHQEEEAMFLLFEDLAFLPVEVFIVTILFKRFLDLSELKKKIKKNNVVITTFYVEAGLVILQAMKEFNLNLQEFLLAIEAKSQGGQRNASALEKFEVVMEADPLKLPTLYKIMKEKKSFMLSLLENSNLLEHDSFTDMLWAVFHVADELEMRDLEALEQEEIAHLSLDLKRAYSALTAEWLEHLEYLNREYPFLYQTAMKKNPLI